MAQADPIPTDTQKPGVRLRLRALATLVRDATRRVRGRLPRPTRFRRTQPPASETSAVARERIEALVGRPVGNLGLYERALRHRSVLRGQPGGHLQSNERLEFLGDAVLGVAVAEKLYTSFPNRDEGFLTRLRAKLVNGVMLASYAKALGLGDLLLLSPNMAQGDGRTNPTILADAFEAVLGALYLDQGFEAARQFVFDVIDAHLDLNEVAEQRSNFKSLLLEYVQARGQAQPVYQVISEEGPSHDRRFTIQVLVEGVPFGTGSARSKKQAEQQAAHEALDRLREEAEDLPVTPKL